MEEVSGEQAEDILLLAWEWRMLLPVRTLKTHEWDDRVLLAEDGEVYEMPNIISFLVRDASVTGQWRVALSLARLFEAMRDPDWDTIPTLVEEMVKPVKRSQDRRCTDHRNSAPIRNGNPNGLADRGPEGEWRDESENGFPS